MKESEPPKDKRTKAYKEWKKKYDADGLGSKIEKLTEATGIKKAVKFIAGEDCGCDERKEKLNKAFRQFNCLTEWEYNYLKDFFDTNKTQVRGEEMRTLTLIGNRIFGKRDRPTSCGSCIKKRIADLKKAFDAYE